MIGPEMIGLDTNILVRYIAQDDAVQSPLATKIIEDRLTEEHPGFISLVMNKKAEVVRVRFHRMAAEAALDRLPRQMAIDQIVPADGAHAGAPA